MHGGGFNTLVRPVRHRSGRDTPEGAETFSFSESRLGCFELPEEDVQGFRQLYPSVGGGVPCHLAGDVAVHAATSEADVNSGANMALASSGGIAFPAC